MATGLCDAEEVRTAKAAGWGCKPFSPHTDDRGVWYIDLPQNSSITYELRFELEGYTGVYYRTEPSGPTTFNVVLTH